MEDYSCLIGSSLRELFASYRNRSNEELRQIAQNEETENPRDNPKSLSKRAECKKLMRFFIVS